MSGFYIEQKDCIGCGLCAQSCPQGVIVPAAGKMEIGSGCVACGLCEGACPVGAIHRQQQTRQDTSQWQGILVVAQQHRDELSSVTLELLCKAKELACSQNQMVSVALAAQDGEAMAQQLLEHGAQRVWLTQDAVFGEPQEEALTQWLYQVIETSKPAIVLFGATELGRSVAPRLAARLGTGLTADCTQLELEEETGLLQQTRPAFGGNLMATICCPNHRPQMATVRPGVFAQGQAQPSMGKIEVLPWQPQPSRIKLLETMGVENADDLAQAQVIVAVGRGIGDQKNLVLARRLAQLLGGRLAVTRPLVDAGWGEYAWQVGQTGCSVAPKLYLALGISGAIQHLAGIGGAQTIVAVNTDEQAPIFQVAQYGLVADCVELIKSLIAQLEAK